MRSGKNIETLNINISKKQAEDLTVSRRCIETLLFEDKKI